MRPGSSEALSLETLETVLPALVTAWLSCFAFAGRPARDKSLIGRQVDLELTDLGNGYLAERTLAVTAKLARALHGGDGDDLVQRVNAELKSEMEIVSALIARHA